MSTKKRSYQASASSAMGQFKAPRNYAYQGVAASSAAAPLARVGGRMPVAARSTGELKDLTLTSTNRIPVNSAAFTTTLLNGCAQGTTAGTRIGRRITMKSLLIRWNIALAATTAGAGAIRILVVYDAQANATAPAVTDILDTDNFVAGMNLSNNRRFKVLCDVILDQGVSTAGPGANCGTRYVRGDWNTEFNTGSAGTIGDIQSGSVYMLTAQSGNLITAAPLSTIFTRIRFQD